MRTIAVAFAVLALSLLSGCGAKGTPSPTPAPPQPSAPEVVVEHCVAAADLADDVDSVAVAPAQGWLLATTKGTHQVLVLDAASCAELRRVGGPGRGPGQLQRPNGIAVAGELVLVVERDNARVQVLRLPELTSLGTFGEGILERPYGIAVANFGGGSFDLWVTDNFDLTPDEIADGARLAERVKRFRLEWDGASIRARHTASFGDSSGDGALWKVETIGVDPEMDRLLVAEEETARMALKVYTLEGRFTGQLVGSDTFTAEPEGIALWRCGDRGVWVATDQHEALTVFHLFDRVTFAHLGAFTGQVTANTDGITLTQEALPGLPAGALYAVHDDHGVGVLDWLDVAAAVGVRATCQGAGGPVAPPN